MVNKFLDFGSSTRGERYNSYYADHTIWPFQHAAYPMMFKISVGRESKNPTTSSMDKIQLSSLRPNGRNSTIVFHGLISTAEFLKSSNSQDHLYRSWRHPHSRPIFCLGFIMTRVIFISFVHERKTVPNGYAPELLTRIVQSPTKLNDKI